MALPSGETPLDLSASARPDWVERFSRHREDVIEIWGGVENMMRLPLGEPLVLSRMRDRALWESNRLYREWGRAQGIHDLVAIGLMRESGMVGSLAFVRHVSAGDIGEPEIETARLPIPHLQRAVAIGRLLEFHSIELARMTDALEALACGVLLTRGAILHANRAAARMLEAGPLREVRGVLQAREPGAARELRAAIALAARDEATIGRTGLAVGLAGPGAPPIFAHVLPLTGGDLRTRLRPAAIAAVFVAATPDERDTAAALAAAYALTPAETRLLAHLLAGRTLAEAAAALGIAATTARRHLDHIFLKTGVARQAELVRLATRVAPPVWPPAPRT